MKSARQNSRYSHHKQEEQDLSRIDLSAVPEEKTDLHRSELGNRTPVDRQIIAMMNKKSTFSNQVNAEQKLRVAKIVKQMREKDVQRESKPSAAQRTVGCS